MTAKSPLFDADDAIRRYADGETIGDIARHYHASTHRVRNEMVQRGAIIRSKRYHVLPDEEIVARYRGGESVNRLAESYGVSRLVIDRRLDKNGVPRHDKSELLHRIAAGTPATERLRRTQAAHAAKRGKPNSFDALCRSAITRQANQSHVGPAERILQRWLEDRGVGSVPQQAIGPYNIDLAIHPVAVEILGGSWHAHGAHRARSAERFRYILDRGWNVLIIWVDKRFAPLTESAADHVVAYLEESRRDPSLRGQYRVVWGDGQVPTIGGNNVDELARVPTRHRRDRGRT